MLRFDRKQQNSVKQLSLKIKLIEKKEKPQQQQNKTQINKSEASSQGPDCKYSGDSTVKPGLQMTVLMAPRATGFAGLIKWGWAWSGREWFSHT